MNKPLLSVIIATHNRSSYLENCLSSIQNKKLPLKVYEIIVVDNNSTDNTKKIVYKFMNKNENIRYVFEKITGLSSARNKGFENAKGEYLIYLDDDCKVPPEYLPNVFKVIIRFHPDILGGPVYPFYLSSKPSWFKDEF